MFNSLNKMHNITADPLFCSLGFLFCDVFVVVIVVFGARFLLASDIKRGPDKIKRKN